MFQALFAFRYSKNLKFASDGENLFNNKSHLFSPSSHFQLRFIREQDLFDPSRDIMRKRYRTHSRSGSLPKRRLSTQREKVCVAAVTTRSIYSAPPTGFDGNGSTDSLPLYGNEAIVGTQRGDLIAFPDYRDVRMPLTPSPSREISSNFQARNRNLCARTKAHKPLDRPTKTTYLVTVPGKYSVRSIAR